MKGVKGVIFEFFGYNFKPTYSIYVFIVSLVKIFDSISLRFFYHNIIVVI